MNNSPAQRIYLLGDINIDVSMQIDRYPACGDEGFSSQTGTHVGGCAANTAVVLAKMGMNAALIGCAGNDLWGRHALKTLRVLGIDPSQVHLEEELSTGITFIAVTPDGERTMFAHRGANRWLQPEDIAPGVLENASILHISGYAFTESTQREAAWKLVEMAQRYDVPISLDTGFAPVLAHPDVFRSLLKSLTICILGAHEISALSGETGIDEGVDWMLSRGIKFLALKLGKDGSLLATPSERIMAPAFPIHALDTTGAGDAFSAGILTGFLQGRDLSSTGTLANALGALAASKWGAGEILPGKMELLEFLQQQKKTEDLPFRL